MAKQKPKSSKANELAPLRHNPFASLGGLSQRADEELTKGKAPDVSEPTSPAVPLTPEPVTTAPARFSGRLVLRRETKRRGGKAVIIIAGFRALPRFDADAVHALATRLKRDLGCGGTVEGDAEEIVLQGDRAAQVAALLRGLGFRVDGVTA